MFQSGRARRKKQWCVAISITSCHSFGPAKRSDWQIQSLASVVLTRIWGQVRKSCSCRRSHNNSYAFNALTVVTVTKAQRICCTIYIEAENATLLVPLLCTANCNVFKDRSSNAFKQAVSGFSDIATSCVVFQYTPGFGQIAMIRCKHHAGLPSLTTRRSFCYTSVCGFYTEDARTSQGKIYISVGTLTGNDRTNEPRLVSQSTDTISHKTKVELTAVQAFSWLHPESNDASRAVVDIGFCRCRRSHTKTHYRR